MAKRTAEEIAADLEAAYVEAWKHERKWIQKTLDFEAVFSAGWDAAIKAAGEPLDMVEWEACGSSGVGLSRLPVRLTTDGRGVVDAQGWLVALGGGPGDARLIANAINRAAGWKPKEGA